jgi:hypothetical protein
MKTKRSTGHIVIKILLPSLHIMSFKIQKNRDIIYMHTYIRTHHSHAHIHTYTSFTCTHTYVHIIHIHTYIRTHHSHSHIRTYACHHHTKQDTKTKEITDMLSFYALPPTIIGNKQHPQHSYTHIHVIIIQNRTRKQKRSQTCCRSMHCLPPLSATNNIPLSVRPTHSTTCQAPSHSSSSSRTRSLSRSRYVCLSVT